MDSHPGSIPQDIGLPSRTPPGAMKSLILAASSMASLARAGSVQQDNADVSVTVATGTTSLPITATEETTVTVYVTSPPDHTRASATSKVADEIIQLVELPASQAKSSSTVTLMLTSTFFVQPPSFVPSTSSSTWVDPATVTLAPGDKPWYHASACLGWWRKYQCCDGTCHHYAKSCRQRGGGAYWKGLEKVHDVFCEGGDKALARWLEDPGGPGDKGDGFYKQKFIEEQRAKGGDEFADRTDQVNKWKEEHWEKVQKEKEAKWKEEDGDHRGHWPFDSLFHWDNTDEEGGP